MVSHTTHGAGIGMMRGNNSYTLLELLLTISIISILAALLATSLKDAKNDAQIAVCKTYKRQMFIIDENYKIEEINGTFYMLPGKGYDRLEVKAYVSMWNKCYDCHASNP